KGNAAYKAADYATAVGHYTTAILTDSSDPTFFLNRAAAYLKLGKNEDAERDCTRVLALSTDNAKALFRRGQARRALGKLDDARAGAKPPFTPAPAPPPPVKPPTTLFQFTKSWDSLQSDDDRWSLIRTIPPSSIPAFFQVSLEPELLKSILHTLRAVLEVPGLDTKNVVGDYLLAFTKVQRFGTVMLFMDKQERQLLELLRAKVNSRD
ncbi:hypothetical protein PAXRUDRAFT_153659, partial [Paxillus rubicundulus Ve08.2h10]